MTKFEEEVKETYEKVSINLYGNNAGSSQMKHLLNELKDAGLLKQQQALPVVPECVAVAIESLPDHCSAFEAISLIEEKIETLPVENEDWLPVYNWLYEDTKNQDTFALAFMTRKYEVEKPQLFKAVFPNSTSVLQKNGELNSFADTVYKRYLLDNAMTEQEIKSIDERYWQFAVPVEDGE